MPHFRYAEHGDLAPYLDQYPALFGLYPPPPVVPIPRQWSSKARRDAGARHRDQGVIVLEPTARSRFSFPSTSPSSSSSTSPKPVRVRLPTFAERLHASGYVSPRRAPSRRRIDPLPTFAQRMEAEQQAKSRKRRTERLPTFAERMHAKVQAEAEAEARARAKAKAKAAAKAEAKIEAKSKSKSKSSKRRSIPLASPPISRIPPQPPPPPPPPPQPIRPDEDFRIPGPTTVKRRNAVRRESRFRPAVPLMQTDPATALPEMSRLDRLLDTISTLSSASSVHLAPSHSHIHSGHALPVLPREVQTQLTNLHAYLSVAPRSVLPDQDSAAARWFSPFRLFPHIRAPDTLSGFDGLAFNPPPTQRGADPLAARWRVLQRIGRERATHARRHYLPGLIALLTALELVAHLRACVDRRGADVAREAAAVAAAASGGSGRRLHRKRDRAPPAPTGADARSHHGALPIPKPLAARARRLDRMHTRLRWQVALVGEALWGGRDGAGDVAGRTARVRKELSVEGFWRLYVPRRDEGRREEERDRDRDRERERQDGRRHRRR